MDSLFIILFLISLILLPIVIIKPRILEKITRRHFTRTKAGLLMGGFVILFFILFGITAEPSVKSVQEEKSNEITVSVTPKPTKTPTNTQEPPTDTLQPTTQPYVFDVPSLIGKDIDEINIELAQYKDKTLEPNQQQINQGVREWDAQYTKDGKELLVTYDIKTKKVVDFFMSTDDPSGVTTDKEYLLKLGNLLQNDVAYSIEFVKAIKYPDKFTGVKVIPVE